MPSDAKRKVETIPSAGLRLDVVRACVEEVEVPGLTAEGDRLVQLGPVRRGEKIVERTLTSLGVAGRHQRLIASRESTMGACGEEQYFGSDHNDRDEDSGDTDRSWRVAGRTP